MHNSLLKLFFTILFAILSFAARCQTGEMPGADDKTGPGEKAGKPDASSSFKFGITYVSNNVYMGRADTVTTPVLVPQVKYTLKSGLYFSGSLYLIPNKPKQKLDGEDLAAGYDFDITDDFSGGASFTKLFYSTSSTQIASAISGTFNVNFDYDIADIITPTLSADYDLNKQGITNDVLISPAIAHDFITKGVFGDEDVLLISPTITANAGTQNFYDAYLTKKNFKSLRLTKLQNTVVANYIDQLGKFELLDFELSAPLEYKTGPLILQLIPIYAIVQNQLPKGISARLSDQSSIFYLQAGVSLKLQ